MEHSERNEWLPAGAAVHTTLAVPGSVMRHGGTLILPGGLAIGSDDWRRVRCFYCRAEMMTPVELLDPFPIVGEDGVIVGLCAGCHHDTEQGHPPGHGRHRRRHRRA